MYERLALAGLHLGDLPLMERHAADELHVEVAQPCGAHTRLAHGGKGLGHKRVERFPRLVALTEEHRLMLEFLVAHRLIGGLEGIDLLDHLAVALDILVRADGEQLGHETHGRSFSRIRRCWACTGGHIHTRLLYPFGRLGLRRLRVRTDKPRAGIRPAGRATPRRGPASRRPKYVRAITDARRQG